MLLAPSILCKLAHGSNHSTYGNGGSSILASSKTCRPALMSLSSVQAPTLRLECGPELYDYDSLGLIDVCRRIEIFDDMQR
jgi:hypothetical protein